ncbi:MAG TPA: ABC-F family ATP-binding cassette domain-containing protein [bacterium]|nr:ABC-F family ATP-binding cassette domain-containing protein [bacterium]
MLRALDIHKAYGPRVVLQGIDLTIHPGDRIGVIGANGSGKSTLLRILGGERPDAGRVDAAAGIRVGLLPQDLPATEGTVWGAALGGVEEILAQRRRWEALSHELAREPGNAEVLAGLGEAHEALERAGGFNLEHRVEEVLAGLGFPPETWTRSAGVLSGGERTRLNLARLLLRRPDVLLLDEPTNHLDVGAIEWLEGFLRGTSGAVVVASHDRRLLNSVVTCIVELESATARTYRGGYDAYRQAKRLELAAQAAAYAHFQDEVARLRRFARAQRDRAAEIASGPKAGRDHYGRIAGKMARRAKAAERRIERLEAGAPQPPRRARQVRIGLGGGARGGPAVAVMREAEVRFADRVLLAGVNLTLRRGDRVGLVGPNGSGKTTILRLLAGDLAPTSGDVWKSAGTASGVLSQHPDLPAGTRPIDVALDAGLSPSDGRALLASLLFRGDRVFEPVERLSGGERTRLALLSLVARRPSLLLLDEPTNHLDLPSRERFEEALEAYAGTLVVASHDRFLLERVCRTVWAIEGNSVRSFEGDYAAYRRSG